MERGRGARLTELGNTLLAAEARLDAELAPELMRQAHLIRDEVEAVIVSKRPSAMRVHASHGLGISLLAEMAKEAGVELDLQFGGSLESLKWLTAGNCEIAGFHVPVGEQLESLLVHYRSYLRSDGYSLIRMAEREQGLIVAADNPRQIRGFQDLSNKALRFVNRQAGSGTRLLVDHLLASAGVRPTSIKGYEHVEFTHVAVAAMVATGSVDAGFGIRAAAAQFGLGFVPVAHEHYFLAVRTESLDEPSLRGLLEVIKSELFRGRLAALPGYFPQGSGEVVSPSVLFGR
jgi:molybdate-binding protein